MAGSGGVADFVAAREHVIREVVRLERELRRAGASVPVNAALAATEALAEVGVEDREAVKAATHATLVRSPRDSDLFAEVFPEFWYRLRTGLEATATHDDTGDRAGDLGNGHSEGLSMETPGALADEGTRDLGDAVEGEGSVALEDRSVTSRRVVDTPAAEAERDASEERPATYSTVGERAVVAAAETEGEAASEATIRRFERALVALAGRRFSASPSGCGVDARRALRESMSTGGVTVTLPTRERTETVFRTCIFVDVSRSVLDAVDRRFLLSVLDALVADGRSTRVFFFDTDVRDVTAAFASSRGDPATALANAEVAWGGGTRIGSSLAAVRERWPDAVDRRTVSIVVSDGLEVGEIDELEAAAAWLSRRSRSVLWFNPLATSTEWEPTCRGMVAAKPYVDGVFAFGGDDDLDDAARQIAKRGTQGPVGYEYDFRDREGEA
jgi:hypothetical protein